jgi:hypothetical protein
MVRFTAIVDVPEDRRVTITLPPDVPVGPWAIEVEAYTPGDQIGFFKVTSLEESLAADRPRIRHPIRAVSLIE